MRAHGIESLAELTARSVAEPRLVLGRRRARPRPRVLDAVRAGRGRVARASNGRPGSSAVGRTSHVSASTGGPSATRRRPAVIWEAEDGEVRTADLRRAAPPHRRRRERALAPRRRLRRPGRDLHADGDRDRRRRDGVREARRRLRADLQRVRARCRRGADRRRGVRGPRDRERVPAAGRGRADEADRRPGCSSRPGAIRQRARVAPAARPRDADDAGPGSPVGGRGRSDRRPRSTRRRSTASTRCSSATRAARRAGRRGPSTCTAGSSSRSRRRSPTRWTSTVGSGSTGSTDLGWIMGPWEIVGALALGATVVLDRGLAAPSGRRDRLWEQVERHRITTLGVSPTLVRALIPAGADAVRSP